MIFQKGRFMKEIGNSMKDYIYTQIIYTIFGILGNRSDKALIAATYLAERIAKRDHYVRTLRRIREMFKAKHPVIQVARKILKDINPTQRKALAKCFVINQMLLGTHKRKAFSESPGGFYPPGLFVISPTMRCNLSCYGCYAAGYSQNGDLSIELIDRIIREAKEIGIYWVVVSGGEPFIRNDLFEIYEKHRDVAFQVYTHGGFLNEKMVGRIKKLGNVLPCISMEGFKDQTDARRGKGHFDKVMKAMDLLREAGLLFAFSATLTRENTDVLTSEEFIDLLIEKGCLLGWYFIYYPIGRTPNFELMPSPEQRKNLYQRIRHFRERKPILFGDFLGDGPVVGGCIGSGRKYFHINNNGDVEPCIFCHYAVDNIKEKPLKDALNSPFFRAIRGQIPYQKNLLRPCMLIDNPEVSRKAIAEFGARPTHPGAEVMFTELVEKIDGYAEEFGKIIDPVWENEHLPSRQAKKS